MRYMLIIFFYLISFNAQSVSLRMDYPKRYTVQPGDTLWSIASKYLNAPWEWKTLWHANPRIKNPNHLYPGAVLELNYYKGNPWLRVLSNGTIKLSPYQRPMPLENPILPIPLMDIKPFLDASIVLDLNILKCAPYIVAFMGEHMVGGQGNEVYVKFLHPSETLPKGSTLSYAVYRPSLPYRKPLTKELIGYKATLVGYGELIRGGEPSVLLLTAITEGVKLRDRVMPNTVPEFDLTFEPRAPTRFVEGTIIDLPPAYTQGAVGLIAVIDIGKDAGLEPGDVLGIYSKERLIQDPLFPSKTVVLPPERIGEVMVFRVFSKTSFTLVVRSTLPVHLMDGVTNP